MFELNKLVQIAHGGPFDVLDAIRAIAIHLTQQPLTDNAKTLALILNSRMAGTLAQAGYVSIADVAQATDYELQDIPGIGPKALAYIRERIPHDSAR